jgi:16S rRNA (guanine527-N7)-methyltransferase
MEIIGKYFKNLNGLQKEHFEKLGSLYEEWNKKINVISRKDIKHIYLHHILHSLAIAKYVQFKPGTKILDVGTGGGFPGIPLAIMFPETQFVLIDSIVKKIKVVEAICKVLKLNNCRAFQIRAENISGQFDFVVSRAVTSLPVFISWIKKSIAYQSMHEQANGILYLKGGDLIEELKIPYHSRVIEIADFFEEPYFESKKIVHVIMDTSS